MRIIDLLNKIANGEELPKKIKYDGYEWIFCKELNDYKKEYDEYTDWLFEEYNLINCLNDEIEIIEEDKPIKKLKLYTNYEILEDNIRTTREICFKINEIIDRLNNLEKKEGK